MGQLQVSFPRSRRTFACATHKQMLVFVSEPNLKLMFLSCFFRQLPGFLTQTYKLFIEFTVAESQQLAPRISPLKKS